MKTSILFLAMFIATGYCYAETEHDTKDSLCCYTADSVLSELSQIDTIHLAYDTTYSVLNETVSVKSSKHKNEKVKKRTDKLANANQQKWPGWLDATLDAVGSAFLWLASPVRPVWGDYTEAGQNTTAPLALFKRSTFAQDKAAILAQIQNPVKNDFQEIYEMIYILAIATPGGWGTSGSQAPNAAYAKFGAFVLLMGVDNTGAPLSSTDSTTIATNVLSILNTCFYYTPKSWFEGGDWWKIFKFNTDWIDWDDVHQYRSKDLIHYCCAYELMRTAGYQNLEPHRKQIKKYATELYWQATDNFSSMSNIINNNLVLMTASSLAMAAMVCNMETDYLWYPWRHPSRWIHKSFARINQTMFTSWTHTESKRGGVYGYREGPWYYAYSMENLMPMFVMFDNYVSENQNFSSLYFENHLFALSNLQTLWLSYFLTIEHVKNFMHDPDWKNTWVWYADLMQANGTAVPYDDSKVNTAIPMLACTKMPNYSLIAGDNLLNLLGNDKPDFLAANNPSSSKVKKVNLYRNRANHQSGNIMLRTEMFDGDTSYHYLHALAEPNPGVLETIRLNLGSSYVHEHADALSFTISAGNELLAIDPPYMGYENRNINNKGLYHNLITVDGHGPGLTDYPVIKKYNEQTKSVHLRNEFRSAATEREIKVYYEEGSSAPYYEIIDIGISTAPHYFKFNLNGNGDKNTGSCDDSKLQTDGSVVWKYPCTKDRDWGMYAKVTSISTTGDSAVFSLTNNLKHGNTGYGSSSVSGNMLSNDELHNIDDFKYSYHSRMEVENYGNFVLFHTIIKPMTCDEIADMGSPAEQGKVSSHLDTSRTVTVIDSVGAEYRKNIHVARTNNSYELTINNPKLASGSGPFPDMVLQAEHGFLSFSPDSVLENGGCKAYTKFRSASMDAGKLLKYDDTIYLQSNQFVDTKYSIESKWKYNGYINTYDSAAVVSYFLPDLAQGVAMTVAGIYTSFSYDTTTFIMTVTFPANTQSKFLFTIADPCMLSCYYPDTSLHIVNMFLQRGRTEALAHKLKILQPSGYLHMAGGAVMNICEYNWLHNKDSLILEDEPNDEPFSLPSKCNPVALSQRLLNQDHIRTSIVVNDKATLVLDSGSYTQIGANSSIYVLPGGTLIIKPNAVVEIGSADVGHGEIIADQGANVCVSPGAIIRFHRNDLDSTDKNLFFVLLNNQSYPNAVSKTNSGISGYVKQMLIDDTLIDVGFPCQPFCDYKSILPPYGIINRDWGYAPFVTPRSSFKVSGDTICPGDSVVINFKKVLNEEGYRFTICKVVDTLFTTNCISGDTSMIDENFIISSDLCLDRLPAPELYKFRVWDTGWFKINMQVYNDCSETHDSTKYIYVPAPPEIVIDIPDSICPGVGTLLADGSATQSHLASTVYRWAIQLVVPDSVRLQVGGIDYGGDWGEFDSTSVSNSFDFPDFRFVGGFKYAIGLSVKGWCGWVTKWDTVEVPLGVMVKTRLASNYQNPVGPSAFEIQGYITGATSYSWSPTDYLDEPDSLKTIARPDMPIEYILTVSDGLCDDSDTIFVSHNNFAYAGDDNLLCMGKGLVLGTNYNGFSLLSVINYLNNSELTSQFSSYETTLDIPKHFTHFMLRNYNYYSNGLTNTFKDDTLLRRYLMEMPDYIESFKKFNQNSNSLEALSDMHNAISSDSWLQNYLATTSGYAISNQECADLFDEFNSWYDPGKFYEISWEHKLITDTSWTLDSNWIDNFNRTENDSISRNHRITVNDVTNSIIEYDEILLKRDTVISVGFTPLQLGDSTVFFSNFSTPVNSLTKYYWEFGDGATSVLKMPVHTFISMDSTYLICLTAINECDSFTYCDTLTLDSNGMHFTFGKRSIHHSSSDTILVEKTVNNFSKTANKLSLNRPNPFSHNTIIEYELEEGYSNAEIRITNTLGQSLKTVKLKGNRGNTIVDGSQWALGMYIYTLIVDGVIIDNRSMVLAR